MWRINTKAVFCATRESVGFIMYFDSHYYLQSSVGLEALYYKAAIELLQRDCELGAMEMMCRAIPDDKL